MASFTWVMQETETYTHQKMHPQWALLRSQGKNGLTKEGEIGAI
jgi:hypothetical protein